MILNGTRVDYWNSADFSGDVAGFILSMVLLLFVVLLIFVLEKLLRKLDRYRLKYGFDRELELKDDNPKTVDRREQRFKERVFKD